jgi:hypothetical protein
MSTQSIMDISYFNPLFKEAVEDQIKLLVPDHEVLFKTLAYENIAPLGGGDYVLRVISSREHGFTALGSGTGSNQRLNDPIVSGTDRASMRPSAYTGRTQIDRVAVSRMANLGSVAADKQSSQSAREAARTYMASEISYPSEALLSSGTWVLEEMLWHGQNGRANVGTLNNSTHPSDFNDTATTTALNTTSYFFDASGAAITSNANLGTSQAVLSIIFPIKVWASALWAGAEGMILDLFTSAGVKIATLPPIQSVDIINRKVTFESAITGNATAIGASSVIYRKGFKEYEGQGIVNIMNTQASVLFGIDQTKKALWSATKVSNGDNVISPIKIINSLALAYGRGMIGSVKMFCSERVFAKIVPDFLTAKDQLVQASSTPNNLGNRQGRSFDKQAEVLDLVHGTKSIKFIIMDMEVELIASGYCKTGDLIAFPDKIAKRIGSSEPTFEDPLVGKGVFFHRLPDYQAAELRLFFDQAPFLSRPNRCLYISDIAV